MVKHLYYAQNPLAAARQLRLGANRRRKLALWPAPIKQFAIYRDKGSPASGLYLR
jgi:hypothetical protein